MRVALAGLLAFALAAHSADATKPLEIRITARRFTFTPKEITVPKGQKVRLLLTALDVNHGFAMDAFKIRTKIEAGAEDPTVVEITPDKEGEYEFYCAVFCGGGHGGMKGKLIVK